MEKEYKEHLQKILDSEAFASSSNFRNLLTYLTECSINGAPAKEIQIANDVFKRNLTENDQDSAIVRVNVHNLRKKLSHYYLTEGVGDRVEFIIPKGRYEVEFVTKEVETEPTPSVGKVFRPEMLIIFALVIVCGVLAVLHFTNGNDEREINKVARSDVWRDFTGQEKKTMLVIGDYYFMREHDTIANRELMVRDLSINSHEDFTDFTARHPELASKYRQAAFSYTGYSTPFILKELVPVLDGSDFELMLMSQFNARYLEEYNVIFVGLFKTMGFLKSYFDYSGFDIDEPNQVITLRGNEDSVMTFKQDGVSESLYNDYAIAAKFHGPANNHFLIITSFHDIGIMDCVKQLTKTETLSSVGRQIEAQGATPDADFEVLLKVIGIDRNELNSEIIKMNVLDSVSMFGNRK